MRAAAIDPRAEGEAYRTLLSQEKNSAEETMADAPLWDQTLRVLNDARSGVLDETYADCTSETRYRDIAAGTRNELRTYTCEQLNRLSNSTRTRDIDVAAGDIDGENFSSSVVTRDFTFDLRVNVPAGAQTVNAVPVSSGTVREVALEIAPSTDNGWVGTWRIVYEDRPCDGLPATASCAGRNQSVSFGYTGSFLSYNETLNCNPEDCLLDTDGFCEAEWTCSDSQPRSINGVLVDEQFAGLMAPLFSGQEGLCFAARAEYQCDYALGTMCWTRPDGTQACSTNTEGGVSQNTCDRVRNEVGICAPVRSDCTEGSRGHNDFCYVESVTYQCARPVDVSDLGVNVTNTCSGTVRCMGDDCLNDSDTAIATQPTMAKTQAQLLLVQHVLSDWVRVEPALATPPGATDQVAYFQGNDYECRKTLGGVTDCCTTTTGGGLALWFSMYPKFQRQVNADIAETRAGGNPEGAWKALSEGEYTNQTLNHSFTSLIETIRGGVHGSGEGGGNAVVARSTDTPAGAGNMAPLTAAFIARAREEVQDPGWSCTQNEFDLAVQREVGMCAKVGQRCASSVVGACLDKRDVYCCFNSPLSKEIRVAMAGGEANGAFGSARSPDCSGVSPVVVAGFDWNTVNLDDLTARMERAGALPTSERIEEMSNIQKITGQQSTIVREGEIRRDVKVRTQARVAEVDLLEAHLGILEDQSEAVPDAVDDPTVVGEITLAQGFQGIFAGQRALIEAIREGSAGAVGVRWSTRDGTAIAGRDYRAASGQLNWSESGEQAAQLIQVETTTQPRVDGQPPREFYIDIFRPTGGAVLGNRIESTIKITPPGAVQVVPAPILGEPSLSFQKRFVGVVPADNQGRPMLGWDVVVTNTSRYPVRRMTIIDVPALPAWAGVDYTRQAFVLPQQHPARCQLGQLLGGTNSFNQPYATCTLNENAGTGHRPLLPGESITWRLYSAADPGTSVSNVCGAQAVFDMGPDDQRSLYYPPGQTPSCMAQGSMPVAGTGPLASCGVATAPTAGLWGGGLQHRLAFAGFPEVRPGSGDSLGATFGPLRVDRWSIYNEALDIPSSTPRSLRMRLGFRREEGRFASTVALTISPCARDLRPSPALSEATTPAACRYVGPPFGASGEASPGLRIAFGGSAEAGVCHLEPGALYYLNYAFYDTRSPIVVGQSTCEAPNQECSLLFDWDEE